MISRMNWQMIRLCDVKPTPWRNGGGTTRELLAWPQSQIPGKDWQWRASVAEISQAGDFSSFPGVQRWFAVLNGEGVGLSIDGELHLLSSMDAPVCFDGGAQTSCTLLSGATQDFNLMLQGGASARMQRVRAMQQVLIVAPKIIAVYANNAPATVLFGSQNYEILPHTFAWCAFGDDHDNDAGAVLQLRATDALLMEIHV